MPGSIEEQLKWAHEYIFAHYNESQQKSVRESARVKLKEWITTNGEVDEDGNRFFEFPVPVSVDGTNYYSGLQLRRRVSEYTVDDEVIELLRSKELLDRCVSYVMVPEIDLDEVYACNQEGIITDEEIDSLIHTDVNYSLERMK